MKLLVQVAIIALVVTVLTALTYVIKGEPNRYTEKEDETYLEAIPAGQIRLTDVIEKLNSNVVWVDARSRSEWKFNGVRNSLFISSDPRENMDQLIEDNMEAIFSAQTEAVPLVIYCGNSGCTDSEMVKKAILNAGFEVDVFLLYQGYGAIANGSGKLIKKR